MPAQRNKELHEEQMQTNIMERKYEKFKNELKGIKEQGKYGCKLKCEEFTNTFLHKEDRREEGLDLESNVKNDHEVEVKGPVVVELRELHIQPQSDTHEINCENFFYTKCHIFGKSCGVIVDNGSCVNIVSQYIIDKLGLLVILPPVHMICIVRINVGM